MVSKYKGRSGYPLCPYCGTVNKKQIIMTQQTAVEWLVDSIGYKNESGKTIISINPNCDITDLIKKAKQIEKEQIINSCAYGITIYSSDERRFKFAEQYYNQTYNK